MRLLVFGQSGQVARELARLAGHEIRCLDRAQADLSDPEAAAAVLAGPQGDWVAEGAGAAAAGGPALAAGAVINAAAYTAVDRAETEETLASRINGAAPAALARAAAARGLPFVHLSTDYVFDGSGTAAFAPDAPTAPLNAYGRSKLAGETGVAAAANPAGWAVLRISSVFSAHGTNFVKTMLRLGAERSSLNVVADQIGGPTPAAAVAGACAAIALALRDDPGKSGRYHLSGAPDVSWADFARAIMEGAGLSCRIDDIPASDYPTPARRPANSRLDCRSTEAVFGLPRPDWRPALADVLTEVLAELQSQPRAELPQPSGARR